MNTSQHDRYTDRHPNKAAPGFADEMKTNISPYLTTAQTGIAIRQSGRAASAHSIEKSHQHRERARP